MGAAPCLLTGLASLLLFLFPPAFNGAGDWLLGAFVPLAFLFPAIGNQEGGAGGGFPHELPLAVGRAVSEGAEGGLVEDGLGGRWRVVNRTHKLL